MMMTKKKTLYFLSTIVFILMIIQNYKLDKECFFEAMYIPLIILVIPLFWNKWLYQGLTENAKKPISYETFIFIGNVVYFMLALFMFIVVLVGYKPANYMPGIC